MIRACASLDAQSSGDLGIHWNRAGSLAAGVALIVGIAVQVQLIRFGALHGICLPWGALIDLIRLMPSVRRYSASGRKG